MSYPFYGQWIIYLVSEISLLLCPADIYVRANIISILCQTLRIITLSLLICAAFGPRIFPGKQTKLDEENSPLLAHEQPLIADLGATGARVNGVAYGSCDSDILNNQSSKDKPKIDAADGVDDEKRGGIWSSMKDLRVKLDDLPLFLCITKLTVYRSLRRSSGLLGDHDFSSSSEE